MQVIIMGRVADSAGAPENGRLEFAQAQRFDDGEFIITQSIAVAQVVGGELRNSHGGPFELPSNPTGTAVRVREMLGGETFEWWTSVPEAESIEYRELPIIESNSVPASVWGPPPWVKQVEQLRDETVTAIQEGVDVAEALGGLAGIQTLVDTANTAAEGAALSEANASAAADQAAASAASIDLPWLVANISSRVEKSEAKSIVYGTDASGEQVTIPRDPGVSGGSVMQRNAAGQVAVATPTIAGHAATKKYVDDVVASSAGAKVDLVSKIREPFFIAHRGGPLVRPEHTMAAYRFAANSGFLIEPDVRSLADGTLVACHDATTNRTMNINKQVAQCTPEEWRTAWVNPPTPATKRERPAFFTDILEEFGGRVVIVPEISVPADADAIIREVVQRGLQHAVILQSFDYAVALKIVAAGCRALHLTNTKPAAEMKAAGIEFVGTSSQATPAYMAACKNAGLKVVAWTMNTKAEADLQIARGAVGVFTDDPWRVSRRGMPAGEASLGEGELWPMYSHVTRGITNPTQRIVLGGGGIDFTTEDTASNGSYLQLGQFGVGGQNVRVRFWVQNVKAAQTSVPETAWIFGIYLGKSTTDLAVTEEAAVEEWRLAMVRRNGEMNAYQRKMGESATTKLGTRPVVTPPYAPPGKGSVPLQFEVEFTPTQVKITNLTLGEESFVATNPTVTQQDHYLTLNLHGVVGRVWDIHVVRTD